MAATPENEPAADPAGSRASPVRYLLSLPERFVRSGTGLVGGALRETAALLVPQSFQNSTTYTVMVKQMLDFLAEDVGGVAKAAKSPGDESPDNFVARKAVGNFLDLASLATLHISPLTLLALVSDVAYGSKVYLHELAAELKQQGVIDANSTIDNAGQLLEAVAAASSITSKAFDKPPLSVSGLKDTIEETRRAVADINPAAIIPQEEIRRMWQEMRDVADREGVDLLAVSGAVTMQSLDKIGTLSRGALSSVRVAGRLVDRHVIDDYSKSLARIRSEGLYRTVAATSQPYIAAVWSNFATEKSTVTDDVLSGKLIGSTWNAMRNWLGGSRGTESPAVILDGAGESATKGQP